MEILNGNREYKRFGEERIIVSTLNIGELYLINLREFGKDYAMKLISKLKFQTLEISNEIIINAMDFKHQYRKRKFSWVDCIGYSLANKYNMRFLTGDEQFKDIKSVEFVK